MIDILRPLLIAGLVLTEVGLWQWRVLIASRGNRGGAVALGAVGAVLQITAISQVVMNVTDPVSVGAYAVGVAAGVLLGLVAGERLTPGLIGVTVVTDARTLADALWARGWPATVQTAHGVRGPVAVLSFTIDRRHEARLHRDVAQLDPRAVWRAEDLRRRPGAPSAAASPLHAEAAGHRGRLAPGTHLQLGEDRRHVVVGGLGRDHQSLGDLRVAQAVHE
jgi:uncharacterized protein YebE (UPF0316 family)